MKSNVAQVTTEKAWSGTRFALATALGAWLIYLAFALVRCIVYGFSNPVWLMERHALTAACAVGMSGLLQPLLQHFTQRSMRTRLTAAAALSIPPAAALSVFNYNIIYVFAPPSYLHDMGMDARLGIVGEILHSSIENYFVFAAWSILWTAVSHAVGTRVLASRVAATEAAARAAELRALRLQLDPHFLFNALNSVSGLIVDGRAGEADRAVSALSSFLRSTLAVDAEMDVSLGDEIALQRKYLEIEQIRFGDRLHVAFDLPEALADVFVPALILQPLVENSIHHAVARTLRPVRLAVRATVERDRLCLSVEDDGPGETAPGLGVGLRNVSERLRLRFGSEAICSHARLASGITRTQMVMPLLLRSGIA